MAAPSHPPNFPEIQAAAEALANLRERSSECDAAPHNRAAERAFRQGTLAALDALAQALTQTAWRAELALAATIEARPDRQAGEPPMDANRTRIGRS